MTQNSDASRSLQVNEIKKEIKNTQRRKLIQCKGKTKGK